MQAILVLEYVHMLFKILGITRLGDKGNNMKKKIGSDEPFEHSAILNC